MPGAPQPYERVPSDELEDHEEGEEPPEASGQMAYAAPEVLNVVLPAREISAADYFCCTCCCCSVFLFVLLPVLIFFRSSTPTVTLENATLETAHNPYIFNATFVLQNDNRYPAVFWDLKFDIRTRAVGYLVTGKIEGPFTVGKHGSVTISMGKLISNKKTDQVARHCRKVPMGIGEKAMTVQLGNATMAVEMPDLPSRRHFGRVAVGARDGGFVIACHRTPSPTKAPTIPVPSTAPTRKPTKVPTLSPTSRPTNASDTMAPTPF